MNGLNFTSASQRPTTRRGRATASWLMSIAAMSLLSHGASAAAGMTASLAEAASVAAAHNRDMRTPNDWGVSVHNRDMRVAPDNRDMSLRPDNRDMRFTPNNRDMRATPNNRDM